MLLGLLKAGVELYQVNLCRNCHSQRHQPSHQICQNWPLVPWFFGYPMTQKMFNASLLFTTVKWTWSRRVGLNIVSVCLCPTFQAQTCITELSKQRYVILSIGRCNITGAKFLVTGGVTVGLESSTGLSPWVIDIRVRRTCDQVLHALDETKQSSGTQDMQCWAKRDVLWM